jgi:hypothetical protein
MPPSVAILAQATVPGVEIALPFHLTHLAMPSCRSGSGCSVRYGNVVVHCAHVSEAIHVAKELNCSTPGTSFGGHQNLDVLAHAAESSSRILDKLTRCFPDISGRATNSFGTLLRVPRVRSLCAGAASRGTDIEKALRYIASASDAHRHLSHTVIDEVEGIVCALADQHHAGVLSEVPPPPPIDFDGIFAAPRAPSYVEDPPVAVADVYCGAGVHGEGTFEHDGPMYADIDCSDVSGRQGEGTFEHDGPMSCCGSSGNRTAVNCFQGEGTFVIDGPLCEDLNAVGELRSHTVVVATLFVSHFESRLAEASIKAAFIKWLHLWQDRYTDTSMQDDDFSQGSSCPHLHSGNLLVDIDLPCKPCLGKGKGNGETGRKQVFASEAASEAVKFKMVLKKYGHKIAQMDEFLSEYRARRNLE